MAISFACGLDKGQIPLRYPAR